MVDFVDVTYRWRSEDERWYESTVVVGSDVHSIETHFPGWDYDDAILYYFRDWDEFIRACNPRQNFVEFTIIDWSRKDG